MPPFFPRNTRVGKCQKWASIFDKMPNLRFLAKRQKRESLEDLILGHPQKRILPKMKSPYIRATLFILKRQNPLSSPIFSFKAFYDFLQGLGLLSLSSLLSLDIPLFSRLSPWFYTKEKDLIERFSRSTRSIFSRYFIHSPG